MSGLGAPALVLAVDYGQHLTDGHVDAVVGLYTAPGQYPGPDGLDGALGCEVCEQAVGRFPIADTTRPEGFIPFVADPVSSGVTLCVPCFASQDHRVWTTEDL